MIVFLLIGRLCRVWEWRVLVIGGYVDYYGLGALRNIKKAYYPTDIPASSRVFSDGRRSYN
jgi:hypothetical protein